METIRCLSHAPNDVNWKETTDLGHTLPAPFACPYERATPCEELDFYRSDTILEDSQEIGPEAGLGNGPGNGLDDGTMSSPGHNQGGGPDNNPKSGPQGGPGFNPGVVPESGPNNEPGGDPEQSETHRNPGPAHGICSNLR